MCCDFRSHKVTCVIARAAQTGSQTWKLKPQKCTVSSFRGQKSKIKVSCWHGHAPSEGPRKGCVPGPFPSFWYP